MKDFAHFLTRHRHWTVVLVVLTDILVWAVCLFSIGIQIGRPFPGFFYNDDRLLSAITPRDFTGYQAGLRAGDIILSVNDQPWMDINFIIQNAKVGESITYTIERAGQELNFSVPTMLFTASMIWQFLSAYFVFDMITLLAALAIFLSNPSRRLNQYVMIYLVSFSWIRILAWENELSLLKLTAYLVIPAVVINSIDGWILFWSFPGDEPRQRFLKRTHLFHTFIVFGLIYIILDLAFNVLTDALNTPQLMRLYIAVIYTSFFILFGIGTLINNSLPLVQIARRGALNGMRQPALILLTGCLIGLTAGLIFTWAPLANITSFPLNTQWGALLSIPYPLAIAYAVIWRRSASVGAAAVRGGASPLPPL